ncbi:hypothetical protein L1987_52019 [Smallanthus sonchifolius]|uniref:Uncharacterized protein n=1 Tax=Smallanthus sonchifolius TaxID=185202 RepID=A0ACB9ERY0_9ASTR|nr:hypothetical protein L1987_52019 [Smallanthus sonchifolius]
MATGKSLRELELPQQRSQDDGVPFPAVLSPNSSTDSTAVQLSAFEDAIKAHKPWLESLLLKSGAILFRGFPVTSPSDFNAVLEAFGFPELLYVGGIAPRTQVVGRVYTAVKWVAKVGVKLEWMGNTAKIITNPLPAIKFDKESRRKMWFNTLTGSYNGPATKKIDTRNASAELGNGDPVDDDAMKDLLKILEEECVAIPWKKGDVLLVNNLTVLHGRRPLIKPPRRILASLCK